MKKKMTKPVSLMIALVMAVTLGGCGGSNEGSDKDGAGSTEVTETQQPSADEAGAATEEAPSDDFRRIGSHVTTSIPASRHLS